MLKLLIVVKSRASLLSVFLCQTAGKGAGIRCTTGTPKLKIIIIITEVHNSSGDQKPKSHYTPKNHIIMALNVKSRNR